jgi:hypothetical protein
MIALRSPASAWPKKSQFFFPSAVGRMRYLQALTRIRH